MLRNVAGQKWRVYAYNVTTGLPVPGDAANITGRIRIDDGSGAATDDAAPTEADATNEPGYYDFDLTQAESNGAKLSLAAKSSTSNVVVIPCPPVIYTRPQYFSLLGIANDGDLSKVNTLEGHTAQTGDNYARLGAPAGASISADIAGVMTKATSADSYAQSASTSAFTASSIVGSGTYGNAALKTLIDAIDTDVNSIGIMASAIVADTSELQQDWTDGGRLDLLVDAIKAKTDNLPSDPADQSDITALQTKIKKYFQITLRSDSAIATDNATELGEINADEGSGAGSYIVSYSLAGTFSTLSTYLSGVITLITTVDTVVDAIKAKTDNLPSDPADQSEIASLLADIQAAADSIAGYLDTEIADILEAVTTTGSDPWNTDLPGSYAAGTAGHILGNRLVGTIASGTHNPQSGDSYAVVSNATYGNANLKTLIDAIGTMASAIVTDTSELQQDWTVGGRLDLILTALPESLAAIAGYLDTEIADILTGISSGTSASAIADAVWDEVVADHSTVGSTGAALAAAGGSGDPWATALPGAYAPGTAGYQIGTSYSIVSSGTYGNSALKTLIDAIAAKTVNLPSDPADQSQIETALDGFATSLNNTIVDEIADLSANMATAANLAVVDAVADNINAVVTHATYGLETFHTNVFTRLLGTIEAGNHHPSSGDAYQQVINSTSSLSGLIASVQDKMIKLFQITLRKDAAIIADRAIELDNINSNSGSGTGNYTPATDSQEAIRDAGGGSGSGSDPWISDLPGDYEPGTAGNIVGNLTKKLQRYVMLLARRDSAITQDAATELSEINANLGSGGGTYKNKTDSLENLPLQR